MVVCIRSNTAPVLDVKRPYDSRMEMDRHQSQELAQRLLRDLELRSTQDTTAVAQVHALIAIAEQLHEVARAIED